MTTLDDKPAKDLEKAPTDVIAERSGGRLFDRALNWIETAGNRLPDPAALFLILLLVVWVVSALLAPVDFGELDPRSTEGQALRVQNQLTGTAIAGFLTRMVTTFTSFHPLGVVLVALLGVGVAEHTGFINASLKQLLAVTSRALLTPVLIFVAIVSHTAADAGYVLVIPLGGVIFYAAGRHPLAGIAAAFAGVSGGFSANTIISSLDPLLSSISQEAAQIIDPAATVNPASNWLFTGTSSVLIVAIGWYITDRIIEPRLKTTALDGDLSDIPTFDKLGPREKRGLAWATVAVIAGIGILVAASAPGTSPLRADDGSLTRNSPLMASIVPLIFLLFLIPGVVYGYVAGTVTSHRDIVKGMSKAMSTMGYYIVMAFFAALFIDAFGRSNLGALLAIKGANFLRELAMPSQLTIVGIIALTAVVNLLIGSASAKWALLAPIFVPMLMQLGISPELSQAAYRVGDSSTNIITPLMPYFPLVVVFCTRYVKTKMGIGTLVSMMLPYSISFIVLWTVYLLIYWAMGIPLGMEASYTYPR